MKRIISVMLVIGLAVVCLATSKVQAEENFDLELKLKQGRVYELKTTTTQSLIQQINNQKLSMKQSFDMDYEVRVKEITAENNYVLTVKYTAFDMKVLDIKSDFGKEGQEELAEQLNKEMRKSIDYILNKEFEISLTPSGKIINIQGYKQMLQELLASEEDKQVKESLQQMLNKDAMEKSWSQSFSYLPEKRVSVGDKWKRTFKLTKPLPMKIVTYYTLKDVTDQQVIINSNAEIKIGSLNLADANKLEINTDFSGKQSGQIILNRTNNWIQKMNLNQEMSGVMSVSDPRRNKTVKLPMEMTIEVETTGSSSLLPMTMAGKKGVKLGGPERISFQHWLQERFNYGLGLITDGSGTGVSISGGYVIKKLYSGRLRFSVKGGYSLLSGEESDYLPPEYWAGLGIDYSFGAHWSVDGFVGLLDDKVGPQLGVTYYW